MKLKTCIKLIALVAEATLLRIAIRATARVEREIAKSERVERAAAIAHDAIVEVEARRARVRAAVARARAESTARVPRNSPTPTVIVHADGGACHGVELVGGVCPLCGVCPDAQSTAFWPASKARRFAS